MFSLGFFFTEGGGSTLAVGRLLRLVKVVLKVPQLRFVLLGFVAGIRAVFPIMGLLLLIIYLYAIMGRLVFGENDRAHFGSMGPTMLTLFQAATLSAWGDMWAVNEYGCDRFDSFGQYTVTNTRTGSILILGNLRRGTVFRPCHGRSQQIYTFTRSLF